MKRIYYVSRAAGKLRSDDLARINRSCEKNNPNLGITGFLVCLGDTFFQVLEGPDKAVDNLFSKKIALDQRHRDILCLKKELQVSARLFPGWHMRIFDLNTEGETVPFAFRQMITALLDSHHTLAQYTQSSVLDLLKRGINPASLSPKKRKVTVFFSDVVGFSLFARKLTPAALVALVNEHIENCTKAITNHDGQVNKITGDGVLGYFKEPSSDAAIAASLELLAITARSRRRARANHPLRYLYGGIGLAHGWVFEGNIGSALKRDYTILGNTVNLASRLESYTRDLGVRLILDNATKSAARRPWDFIALGKHHLKGIPDTSELHTIDQLNNLDTEGIYRTIETKFGR